MKKRILTIMALGCCMVCLAATIVGIDGKWTGSVNVNGADYPLTYEFKVDGEKLTGTAQAQGDPKPINDGKIKGNDLTFSVADDNGGDIPHVGKYYADGDSVSMNIDYQGTKLHTTLKRSADK